jgi:hypothetical protein
MMEIETKQERRNLLTSHANVEEQDEPRFSCHQIGHESLQIDQEIDVEAISFSPTTQDLDQCRSLCTHHRLEKITRLHVVSPFQSPPYLPEYHDYAPWLPTWHPHTPHGTWDEEDEPPP